jgi:hypothetical protein
MIGSDILKHELDGVNHLSEVLEDIIKMIEESITERS